MCCSAISWSHLLYCPFLSLNFLDPVVAQLEATISDLRHELGNKELGLEKEKETNASLEARNKELESANFGNASREVAVDEGSDDDIRSELQATKASLAEALAKIEEDEQIVIKWEGTLFFLLYVYCASASQGVHTSPCAPF